MRGWESMEKMSKEQISKYAKQLLKDGNVLAKVSTNLNDAVEMLSSGFVFCQYDCHVLQEEDVDQLYINANENRDLANVIVVLSPLFLKEFLGLDYETYNRVLVGPSNEKRTEISNWLLQAVADITVIEGESNIMDAHMPCEHIKGVFTSSIQTDNEYTYMENPNYFDNLSEEKRMALLSDLRRRFSFENTEKSNRIR